MLKTIDWIIGKIRSHSNKKAKKFIKFLKVTEMEFIATYKDDEMTARNKHKHKEDENLFNHIKTTVIRIIHVPITNG